MTVGSNSATIASSSVPSPSPVRSTDARAAVAGCRSTYPASLPSSGCNAVITASASGGETGGASSSMRSATVSSQSLIHLRWFP